MSPSPGSQDRRDRRRIDQILADGYLDDLAGLTAAEIRAMRDACEHEESAISYARRVVQGRIDIVRAESQRRGAAGDAEASDLLAGLADILAGEHQPTELSRLHATRLLVPPDGEHDRRALDRVGDETVLADVRERPTDELRALAAELAERERELSRTRQLLFDRIDTLQDELAGRYKSGEADLSGFLAPES